MYHLISHTRRWYQFLIFSFLSFFFRFLYNVILYFIIRLVFINIFLYYYFLYLLFFCKNYSIFSCSGMFRVAKEELLMYNKTTDTINK